MLCNSLLDRFHKIGYTFLYNEIGQFVTILSVNKTRDLIKRWPHFCGHFLLLRSRVCDRIFLLGENIMKNTRFITHSAIFAALYAALTYAQYLLWPGSTSMAIQVRISEALCVFAFFTPAAVPGLTLGCLIFNLTFAGTLPLDWLVGTLATLIAAEGMWLTRKLTVKGYPLLGMLLPAVTNALLVGWELTVYIGESSFWYNALFVALGELIALLAVGSVVFYAVKARGLDQKLFA